MLIDLLHSSYFSLFLIVALGFMLGRIKIKGLSLDVSAVIFIALLFGHFGVIIPKELGNFGLVLFIFTIGIQAGPGFFDSFRSKGKTLILITMLIICSACLTAVGLKYAFDIDTPSVVGLIGRGIDQYARSGGSYRQYKFTVGFHCIRYCLPVWSDRGDFVCEAVTQDYAGGSG